VSGGGILVLKIGQLTDLKLQLLGCHMQGIAL